MQWYKVLLNITQEQWFGLMDDQQGQNTATTDQQEKIEQHVSSYIAYLEKMSLKNIHT